MFSFHFILHFQNSKLNPNAQVFLPKQYKNVKNEVSYFSLFIIIFLICNFFKFEQTLKNGSLIQIEMLSKAFVIIFISETSNSCVTCSLFLIFLFQTSLNPHAKVFVPSQQKKTETDVSSFPLFNFFIFYSFNLK